MSPEAPCTLPASDVEEETAVQPRWKVLLHNDEVTTFEFVIWLLVTLFQKEPEEAIRLTYEVHETEAALVTVTTKERAELYLEQVRALARPRGFPLVASMEPE